MKNELYKAIKSIDIGNLSDEDNMELLKLFMVTKNGLIRDQLAFIFSDLHYNKAIPFIIKKINEKRISDNNGALVSALHDLDVKKYFLSFIKIICEHEYEPRLMAYGIIQKYVHSISNKTRASALKILEECRVREAEGESDKGENSKLHFIEKTIELLGGHPA